MLDKGLRRAYIIDEMREMKEKRMNLPEECYLEHRWKKPGWQVIYPNAGWLGLDIGLPGGLTKKEAIENAKKFLKKHHYKKEAYNARHKKESNNIGA